MLKIKMQTDAFCFTCLGVFSKNPTIILPSIFFSKMKIVVILAFDLGHNPSNLASAPHPCLRQSLVIEM